MSELKIVTREDQARRTLAEIIARVPAEVDLVYVDYRDEWSDEQLQLMLNDDYDELWETTEEHESDSRWQGVKYVMDEVIESEEERDLLIEFNLEDELRDEIQERDSSNWYKDMHRNTPDKLLSVAVGYDVPDYTQCQTDEEIEEHVAGMAEALGIELGANRSALAQILAEASYGGELRVIWYGAVEPALSATGATFTDPCVVILDRWNGSGMDGRVTGTVTVKLEPGDIAVDSQMRYGWDAIAGVVHSAYACDVTYVKAEIKENA